MIRSRRLLKVLSTVVAIAILPACVFAGDGIELDTVHKYLGYTTVALVGATAATGGGASSDDHETHEALATATAVMALGTLITGYIEYSERFDTSDGLFSKDNVHILSAAIGAIALTTAVAIADDGKEESHSGLGVAGGLLMAVAVVDIKW
jgi:hypothetical protein